MTRIVATLYDNPEIATEVMNDLRGAGFDAPQIECIEPDPESPDFSRRLHTEDRDVDILDQQTTLEKMTAFGIPEDDAERYTSEISAGFSLVAVKAEEEISGRARQIMNRYPLAESRERTTLDPGPRTFRHPASEEIGDTHRAEVDSDDYPETDIIELQPELDASDTADIEAEITELAPETTPESSTTESKDLEAESVGPEPTTADDQTAIGELSGRVAEERFKLYRPKFYRHYVRHYSAISPHDFETYARAYRYGMALATSTDHRGEGWDSVQPSAQNQWERRMGHPFNQFREAIRFGWYVIRGEEEKYYGRRL